MIACKNKNIIARSPVLEAFPNNFEILLEVQNTVENPFFLSIFHHLIIKFNNKTIPQSSCIKYI